MKYFIILLTFLLTFHSYSQLNSNDRSVSQNTTFENGASIEGRFDVTSTTLGSQPCPIMTSTQRDAIASPATGDCIFNSTDAQYEFYSGSQWDALGGGTSATIDNILIKYNLSTGETVDSNIYSVGALVGINQASSFGDLAIYDTSDSVLTLNNATSGSTSTDGLFLRITNNVASLINKENDALFLGTNGTNILEVESDGTLSTVNSTYETLVTEDDDIPNKKYVDDLTPNATTDDVVLKWDTTSGRAVESNITQASNRVGINISPVFGDLHVHDTGTDSVIHTTNSITGTTSGDGLFIRQTNNIATILNKENDVLNIGTNNTNDFRLNTDSTLEALAVNYETLVTTDDIIPNKKYVDDEIATSAASKQDLDGDLSAIASLSSTGFAVRTGTDTYAQRQITGTANETEITNGSGVAGDVIVGIVDNPVFSGNESITVPSGTIAQRPTGVAGMIRYNSDDGVFEGYTDDWGSIGAGSLGSAQTITIVQSDDDAVDLSGNNATFDGGGTISGTITQNTTASNFLTGEKSVYFYDSSATPQNDYFGFTRDIPQGWRGRTIAYEFTYRTDAVYQNGDIVFHIKDNTNSDLLLVSGQSLDQFSSANGNGKTIRGLVNIPEDAASLDFGFQVTGTTANFDFFVDKISLDIDDFNYKNIEAITEWTDYTPTLVGVGTTSNQDIKWRRLGDSIEIQGRWTNGTVTATEFQLPLPSGYTVSSDYSFIQVVGEYQRGASNETFFTALATSGDSFLNVGYRTSSINAIATPQNANTVFGTGNAMYINAKVKINEAVGAYTKHVVVDSGEAETESYYTGYVNNFWDAVTDTNLWDASLIKDHLGNSAASFAGSKFLTIEELASETRIKALQDVVIDVTLTSEMDTNSVIVIRVENGDSMGDVRPISGSARANASASIKVLQGSYIYFQHTDPTSNMQGGMNLTVRKATQGEYHLVPAGDQLSQQVYSTRVGNFWDSSATSRTFDTTLLQGDPIDNHVFEVVDNFTTVDGTATIIRCKVDCDFGASLSTNHQGNGGSIIVHWDGATARQLAYDGNEGTDNRVTNAAATGYLKAGNYIWFVGTSVRSTRTAGLAFWAKPRTEKVFLGNVATDYFQKKYYNGTAADNEAMITFSNLTIGRVYRFDGQCFIQGASTSSARCEIEHDSTVLGAIYYNSPTSSGTGGQAAGNSVTFTATATTAIFRADDGGGQAIIGDNTGGATWATLTELNHTQETTRF